MHSSILIHSRSHGWQTRFANLCAILVMGVGMAVMLGWVLDLEPVKRVFPHFQTMKFNTAFGLLLAGSALKWRDKELIRLTLGCVILLLGLLSMMQYLMPVEWGIDQLFIRDLDPGAEFPGRMALITGFCFLLIGLALILLNTEFAPCRHCSEFMAAGVAVIAAFALLGYATSVKQLYQVPGFSGLSLHASVALLALGLGMLSVIPHSVLELFVISHRSHRKIWCNFAVLMLILSGIGIESIINPGNLLLAASGQAGKIPDTSIHRAIPLALLIMAMILVIMVCAKILRIILANETMIQNEKISLKAKTDELAENQIKLQAQHTELDWLYQNSPVGLCLLDPDLRFLRINRNLAELNGLPVEAHVGRTVGEIVPTLEAEVKKITAQISLTGRAMMNHEFSGETAAAPGVTRYWNESWFPVFGAGHKLTGYGVVVEEITERKIAENAMQESEERLRLAQMSANVGVWDWNLQTGKLAWTPELEALYGLEPGTVSQYEDFSKHVHQDDLEKIESMRDDVIQNHHSFDLEFRIIRPSGELRWINSRGGARYDENGKPVRILGNNTDITERKLAEQALLEGREYARKHAEEVQAILDAAPVAIWIAHDPECRVITGNIYGNEVILRTPARQNVSKSAPPGTLSTMYRVYRKGVEVIASDLPAQRACASGQPVSPEELQLVFEDGRSVSLLIGATPLFDAHGRTRGAVAAGLDISERKVLEYKLRDFNQRKDEFFAMLSDELRNPLSVINSTVQLLASKPLTETNQRWACDVLNRNVERLDRLAGELLDVSRFSSGLLTLQKEAVDLNQILQECVRTAAPLTEPKKQALACNLPETPVFIEGDPARLTQIFNNLLGNAIKFTGTGGKIGLKVAVDGVWVVIRIEDNGIGIDPRLLPYIFEFYTQGNLPSGLGRKSLGIGLFLTKQLVELHGGKISASSAGKNEGAAFDIWLPRLMQKDNSSVRPASQI